MEDINDLPLPIFTIDESWEEIKHIPIKRGFDIIFSALVLGLLLPLFLIIAFCIYLSSPGSVIYYQKRIGRGGKTFRCYKFRTMVQNAEAKLQDILQNDEELRKEWNQTYKLKKDPRITTIGAFLRKTSLDELPQFWNVLKGDLSVVGPRPVVKEELDKYFGEERYKILSIRPGITGLWQISGRSDILCYKERIRLDKHYVENHSLLLDTKIVWKTIFVMIGAKGAY